MKTNDIVIITVALTGALCLSAIVWMFVTMKRNAPDNFKRKLNKGFFHKS